MSSPEYEAWVADARAVDIADYARSLLHLKLTPTKDGYIGACPHCGGDDRFVITSNRTKKVFRCRNCDVSGDVIKLVQFLDDSTFNDAVEKLTGKPKPSPERKGKLGKIVAEYPYTDAFGKLSFQVVRFEPKTFRYRRPPTANEQATKDGWMWKRPAAAQLVPYRLPAVLAAIKAGQPVVLVEGEKDVATAEALGFTATCAPGGIGDGWKVIYDQHFVGGDILILPDNDKDPTKGPAYARTIAAHLVKVARRVRLLTLPTTVTDLSEWRAAGGTREQLETLAEATPDFVPQASASDVGEGASLDDFRAYMPQHSYIYVPSREMWPAASVNARIPPVPTGEVDDDGEPILIRASTWLDQNQHVEQMTWAPGFPMLILDRLVSEGGWITKTGDTCFNLYRPPTLELGDASKAGPWLDHVHKVFGDDTDHIIKWLAHRVQRPQEKINHALVAGSPKQGIGKDAHARTGEASHWAVEFPRNIA